MLLFLVVSLAPIAAAASPKPTSASQYDEYIGALLKEPDFGMHYYDDGAADASVLLPDDEKPRASVLDLLRIGPKSVPPLIDCLKDGRLTTVEFDGNVITRQMRVPVGYVCLDILMGVIRSSYVSELDCAEDGLGACMKTGFYFRPDDYYLCSRSFCAVRPWVDVVQANWRRAFLGRHLRFFNPYDHIGLPEYEQFDSKHLR